MKAIDIINIVMGSIAVLCITASISYRTAQFNTYRDLDRAFDKYYGIDIKFSNQCLGNIYYIKIPDYVIRNAKIHNAYKGYGSDTYTNYLLTEYPTNKPTYHKSPWIKKLRAVVTFEYPTVLGPATMTSGSYIYVSEILMDSYNNEETMYFNRVEYPQEQFGYYMSYSKFIKYFTVISNYPEYVLDTK